MVRYSSYNMVNTVLMLTQGAQLHVQICGVDSRVRWELAGKYFFLGEVYIEFSRMSREYHYLGIQKISTIPEKTLNRDLGREDGKQSRD